MKKRIVLLLIAYVFMCLGSQRVSAEEVVNTNDYESPKIEININSNNCEPIVVEKDGVIWTFRIEDEFVDDHISIDAYHENWSYGSYSKRLTATFTETEHSIFGSMSAVFTGRVTPDRAAIYSVSDGVMYSTVITPTGEKSYEITKAEANPSEYGASANYSEFYNILGAGHHKMCLYFTINTSGRVIFWTNGIWS